jgi:hypothetical protein
MGILKFKQFESYEIDNFPSFQDVEEYFYDFLDEIDSKLYGYQSGYKFYLESFVIGEPYRETVSKKSNYIDIVDTKIPNKKLEFLSNYCYLENRNFSEHPSNQICLDSIRNGAKAYKHLMIQFADTLFSKSKLDLLIECLKRFYHVEGFRPYGDLWTESWISPGYNKEEKLGFVGMLVNCSDEEYIKMAQLIEPREFNKKLIQHFI